MEKNVYFISDLHLCHKNILKYSPNRYEFVTPYKEEHNIEDDIEAHDKWIIDKWLETTKRGDHIYVVGDFILSNQETSMKILHKLKSNGCKIHLVVGNHDKSTQKMFSMFESIDLIKVLNFKKSEFPFIEEDIFQCVLCHYPFKSWFNKCRGSLHIYGHVHANSPWMDNTDDLALNVGFDTPFAHHGLIPLEKIYEWYKGKLGGLKPTQYIENVSKQNKEFIR